MNTLKRKLMAMQTSGSPFIELKYIETKLNQKQYIILPYYPTSKFKIEIIFYTLARGTTASIYSATSKYIALQYYSTPTNFRVYTHNQVVYPTQFINTLYKITHTQNKFRYENLTTGRVDSLTFLDSSEWSSDQLLYLFGGPSGDNTMQTRIYGLKIYESDTLIFDLVPSLRMEDTRPGLLDKISGEFYLPYTGDFDYSMK